MWSVYSFRIQKAFSNYSIKIFNHPLITIAVTAEFLCATNETLLLLINKLGELYFLNLRLNFTKIKIMLFCVMLYFIENFNTAVTSHQLFSRLHGVSHSYAPVSLSRHEEWGIVYFMLLTQSPFWATSQRCPCTSFALCKNYIFH